MIYVILIAICLIWMGAAYYLDNRSKSSTNYEGGIVASIVCLVIIILIAGIASVGVVYTNIDDIESSVSNNRKLKIYIEKKDVLQRQYNALLDSTYGKYEGKMYDKMTEKNSQSNVAVNVYPSPKYSETILELTKKITELNENIYDVRIKQSDIIKDIGVRYRNPFNIRLFLPTKEETLSEIPKDLFN